MAKASNTTGSGLIRVTVSNQSVRLLDDLAAKGIYGRNRAEVAGRFIDEALQRFVQAPRLKIRTGSPRRAGK
jgi:hypothetical protein